jgi:hypothetical protein
MLLGIHPLHFNQLYSAKASIRTCGDVWFQHSWQDANKIGREDLAQALQDAERMISSYVGYSLLPDWITGERHKCPHPARPELFMPAPVNVRGLFKSVSTTWKYVLAGGVRTKDLITAGVVVIGAALSDEDGDAWTETVTIAVTLPAAVTDPDEVRVYFPGMDAEDGWEIRPIDVAISGLTATITFKRWQLVDPDLTEGMGVASLDGDLGTNFVGTVDVYRVWNDPQAQADLEWEPDPAGTCGCGDPACSACTYAVQTACLGVRDSRLGMVTYRPAAWDAATASFAQVDLGLCREPDRVRLWYYAGWKDAHPRNTQPATHMDPFWQRAVIRLAAGLIDRAICSCNNAESFVDYWRRDMAVVEGNVRFQGMSPAQLDNPFGTTRGAIYAYRLCNLEGIRVAP